MVENITIEEAVVMMLETIEPITATEEVELANALHRSIAMDQVTTFDQPPFPRSPIDGYACQARDIVNASKETPVKLQVIADISAGQEFTGDVQSGQAIRIMTGAPIPASCDCCIRQEDTDYGEEIVIIYQGHQSYDNYCFKGEDFPKGKVLLTKDTKVSYIEMGILASMGVEKVVVYRKPKIAILTTGDELILPGQTLLPGKIYNSNQFLLLGRLQELGIQPTIVEHMVDEEVNVANRMQELQQHVDLLITTGGVSVGKKDIFHEALTLAGASKKFWRVRVKPGSPTIFSTIGKTPIISLSGNPFGALVNFECLVRPMLSKLTRDISLELQKRTAILEGRFPKGSKGRRIIRAIYNQGKVNVPKKHASGILSSASGCNCLIDIPAGSSELITGDSVTVWML